MQFASGEPPDLVYKRDLQPEVSYDEAHAKIAQDAADFMDARCQFQKSEISDDAATRLSLRLEDTLTFIEPIIDALEFEVLYDSWLYAAIEDCNC